MNDVNKHSFTRTDPNPKGVVAPGYWIINVRIHDLLRYERYLEMAIDAIDSGGGDLIIRTSDGFVAAGNPKPRLVVVKFSSYAVAMDAFASVSQQAALLVYDQIADYDVMIVEGLDFPF